MREVHVDRVDLNLVPALAALLEERHVSRAATRVRLTQPAMSRVLSRLRRLFEDDLLVRGTSGYELTPRAEELRGQLLDVLPALGRLFTTTVFDPASAEHEFRLVGSDYAVLTFGADLFAHLLRHSPGSTLSFENWGDTTFASVDDGLTDLVFYGADAPAHLRQETLFTDAFVCLVATGHALATGRRPRLDDYLAWPHLVVSVDGGLQPAVDGPLARLGTPRRAGLTVPFHSAAAPAVQGTDLVATVPARLLGGAPPPGTTLVAAPREVEELVYSMLWSRRLDNDPAHLWLRGAVRASLAPMRQAGTSVPEHCT